MVSESAAVTDLARTREYYAGHGVLSRVREAVDSVAPGRDLPIETLAPLDQNHIGGAEQTRRLARAANLAPGSRVLDSGSALGGTTRHLTREFGWRMVGLDLSLAFCGAAQFLGTRIKPGPLPTFVCGSALELPFPDASFDGVWTQHAIMNISPKEKLFAEVARVLRSGGRLVIHEVLSGPRQPIHLPVPWASEAELNQLSSEEELREVCQLAGFGIPAWNDTGREALAWFRSQAASPTPKVKKGVDVVFERTGSAKLQNVVRNLLERRIRIVEAVLEKEKS